MANHKKIEEGQCYEKADKVYEVVRQTQKEWWFVKDTTTKEISIVRGDELITWRRPFQNFG